jgi:hypothetical protein
MLRLLGVLALTTLWVGASASAQEREARLQSGPMTERPIAIMSGQTTDSRSLAQIDNCQNQANAACNDLCDRSKNPTSNGQVCAFCIQQHLDRCRGK